MAQFQLVLRVGPSPGKVYPIMKNELTIGRDINNEIVINDAEISRRHCRLVMSGESYLIEDLGSTNGTWINEQRLTGSHQLVSGESIRLGDNVVLEFGLEGFDEDATVVSAQATTPPPQPAATPPKPQPTPTPPPQQPPQFAGQVASGPAPAKKGINKGLLIGCGGLLALTVCVVGIFWIIDILEWWCMPGLGDIIEMFGYYCP